MWKSVTINLGQEEQLDPPNENFTVKVIPLMWLPGKVSTDIMTRLQAEEKRAEELEKEGKDAEVATMRLDGVYETLPAIVGAWNLKDPATGADIPIPAELVKNGRVDQIRSLPMQILTRIVNTSLEYGMDTTEPQAVTGGASTLTVVDPDEGDAAAKAIPFENASVSDLQSSPALGQIGQ